MSDPIDRMDIHELGEGDYRALWQIIKGCCIVLMICGGLLAVVAVSRLRAEDNPLCVFFDALAGLPGVEIAEWVGYPTGWKDYPETWDYETFLPILSGGILQRVAGRQQWLWGYESMETWTDANGEHDGHHDFCETVLVIDQ